MRIVTGYTGTAHIKSNDDQGLLQGIFGTGNYVLPVGNQFAATLISSNELQIADGEGVLQGVHFRIEPANTDSVVIENGAQGMQRIDLICARYQKDPETGIESMDWVNHKGTPAASSPATPSYTPGDLLAGDTLAEFPVYAVKLNGLTVDTITAQFTVSDGFDSLKGNIAALSNLLYLVKKDATGDSIGNLVRICQDDGFYLLFATYSSDALAYFVGTVYKASGEGAIVTTLAHNKLTLAGANTIGTVAINYNGSGSSGVVGTSYRFI